LIYGMSPVTPHDTSPARPARATLGDAGEPLVIL
jgi:hypothetical protein